MKSSIINTKEIRQDLVGFLQRLQRGEVVQVMYRSKPLVQVAAQPPSGDPLLAADAGTPAAARRSVQFVRGLPKRPAKLDPDKDFKQLYTETR